MFQEDHNLCNAKLLSKPLEYSNQGKPAFLCASAIDAADVFAHRSAETHARAHKQAGVPVVATLSSHTSS